MSGGGGSLDAEGVPNTGAAAVRDHLIGIQMKLNGRARDVMGSAGFVEGMIRSVCHLQRGEDVLFCVNVEGLAAEFFYERLRG